MNESFYYVVEELKDPDRELTDKDREKGRLYPWRYVVTCESEREARQYIRDHPGHTFRIVEYVSRVVLMPEDDR